MKPSRAVTIADIAASAGVSKAAVSYALNTPDRLAEATVQRIREAADRLGYAPNPVARSMSIGRTGTFGVLVPQSLEEILANPFFAVFLAGVAATVGEAGYSILLVPPVKGSMERAIGNAAVDGFLTLGLETFRPTMHVLERRGLPYVMVDSEPTAEVACINVDDEGGARSAMDLVLESGHRRIALLGIRSPQRGRWRDYTGTLQRRIAGYRRALAGYGLDLGQGGVRLIECDVSEDGGRRAMARLLAQRQRPSAIVAMSDLIAIGALEEALERGLSLPDDLSIIGFDDIPQAGWVRPGLTTVRQPVHGKGRMAASLLIDLVAGSASPRHLTLPTELVMRDSVGPPGIDAGHRGSEPSGRVVRREVVSGAVPITVDHCPDGDGEPNGSVRADGLDDPDRALQRRASRPTHRKRANNPSSLDTAEGKHAL